jgi:Chitobiase/beta-hexosaminidase C-terminal domain
VVKFFLLHLAAPWCKRFIVEKITLSFTALAAIIAMTILQACVGTPGTAAAQCAKPRLTPSNASNAITSVRVTITTATAGAYLRYTLDGSTPTGGSSGNGTEITASKGTVLVEFGVGPKGTTLKAIAYKKGLADSLIADGKYVYESPY